MQIITGHSGRLEAEGGVMATVGMFDGVHRGHVFLLKELIAEAQSRGLAPAVVTFTNHPLTVIAPERCPRLLTTVGQRLERIEDTGIGRCLLLEFTPALRRLDPSAFLRFLKERMPLRAIMAGFNHTIGRREGLSLEEAAEAEGVGVVRAAGLEHGPEAISSSRIRLLLAEGDVAEAGRLLGRSYRVRGNVEHGRHIGRTIGFPTANLRVVDADKLIPADGVYACVAEVEGVAGRFFRAMVNIGTNPTVSADGRRTIEAHLIGLDPDTELYGRTVNLHFAGFIREERRFDSLEALQTQLQSDLHDCLKILDNKNILL